MTKAHSPSVRTVVDLLRDAADRLPDRDTYIFLDGEGREIRTVNRAALELRARALGAYMVEQGLGGERALLVYPPGIEFLEAFYGCLFAGVVAVPVYPPDMNRFERSLAKLDAIHADARPAALLTTTEIAGMVGALNERSPVLAGARWLTTDDVPSTLAEAWRPQAIDERSLAFLQYTSGSTSSPKGVMVSHANMLANWELQRVHMGIGPETTAVSWLPLYHDMGLLGAATQAVYSDGLCVLMEPYTFLRRPVTWLEALSRYKGKIITAGPNFAYDLAVRKVSSEAVSKLDLRDVASALIAAEPIRAETVDRFAHHFGPAGFRRSSFFPAYGLAEATLIVTGARLSEGPIAKSFDRDALTRGTAVLRAGGTEEARTSLVSSGQRITDDQEILVVDPDTHVRCKDRTIGEIWVSGSSVACGYWQNPSATRELFGAMLSTGEGPFLRTGDLGFLDDGELFLTGRIKDLVIIHGVNHAPQDLELTAERAHPAMRRGCSAAFSVPSAEGVEQLVIVAEVDPKKLGTPSADDAGGSPSPSPSPIAAVRAAVSAEHGLMTQRIALVAPGSIPKTSSGKIQRGACKKELLERTLDFVHEDTLAEPPTAAHELPELFVVSAPTKELLARHLGELHALVDSVDVRPVDVAYTLTALRARGVVRVAFTARGRDELLAKLESARLLAAHSDDASMAVRDVWLGSPPAGVQPSIAMVFPGQGAQTLDTCADLYERFPAFRTTLDRLASTLDGVLERPLLDYLYSSRHPENARAREKAMKVLTRTDVCQPALAAVSLALSAFARTLGIHPAMTIGHSLGELVAAAAGGMFSDEDAVRFVATRGRIMQAEAAEGGAMLAVGAGRAILEGHRADMPGVWLVNFNHPKQVVLAGGAVDLANARERLELAGIPSTVLAVSHAFHSPLMQGASKHIAAAIDDVRIGPSNVPVISCVEPGAYPEDPASIRRILAAHATSAVDFEAGVTECATRGARIWLQMGAGSAMVKMAASTLRAQNVAATVMTLANSEPDAGRALADALGRLIVLGVDVDTRPLFEGRSTRAVTLPTTPMATREIRSLGARSVGSPAAHVATHGPTNGANGATTQPSNELLAVLQRQLVMLAQHTDLVRQEVALLTGGAMPLALSGLPPLPPLPLPLSLAPANLEMPQESASRASIAPAVTLAIGRVTGHATSELRLEQRLASDLGFDSLMFAELGGELDSVFRDRGKVPEQFASDNPTIGEVIAFLETHFDGQRRPSTSPRSVPPLPAIEPPRVVEIERPAAELGDEVWSIDAFPEVKGWKTRLLLPDALRIDNPYFKVHEGVARDTSEIGGNEVLNFASYNYLGLGGAPAVTRAAIAATERYGTSASASRIASGERPPHGDLERALATFLGCEASLVLVGGHATNVTVIGHLLGPQDLILHDSLAHDSILGGVRLSGARRRAFPHNDMAALDRLLTEQRTRARRVLIAVEGVYSMDGDVAPLAELIEIKNRHKALLYVDEAHSLGVLGATGRGIGENAGIDRRDVELWMGTLSKSLASCGGYIAGSQSLIDFLKYSLPGFVYSVGLPPASAAAALASLELLVAEPERVTTLRARSAFFIDQCRVRGIDTGAAGPSAIVPCIVGNSLDCLRLSDALMNRGINVQPVLYPAVEEHLARLRFFVSSSHSEDQLALTARAVSEELERLGNPHRHARGLAPSTTPTWESRWVRPNAGDTTQSALHPLPEARNVFVTGGNGFIGSHVVRRLEGEGHTVRCLLRKTSRTERLDDVPYERHLGDVRDLDSLVAGARGMDTIIHMASVSSWADIRSQASALEDIIVGGTRNVLEAARRAGVRRVVLVSSATAVNASTTPTVFDETAAYTLADSSLEYSKAKHRSGELARRYADEGMDVVTLLPAEVYGPHDDDLVTAGNLIDIIKSRPAYAPAGGTSIAHVEDVAEAIVAALDRGRSGERYILGGDCLMLSELMTLVLALAGRSEPVVPIPNDVLIRLCHSSAAAGLQPPISLDVLEYATRYWFVDSAKAMRELGYAPRKAQETLAPVVAWLRETRRIS
jgi:8-amino-7-oxononanoate synthase